MFATCLINNFNYGKYVGEAVESALRQSRPFDSILVVDDGSTDGSQQLLTRQFGNDARVQILRQPNGGQLFAFNSGIAQVCGDLVFFLDADDRYRPDYLQKAVACYERTGADFVIAGLENFGPAYHGATVAPKERDLGYSVLTTIFAGTWVGGPTSSLSMRASLAKRILPYPYESQWKVRADNILVYGASILGARKYQMGELLVERRVHGENLYFGRSEDPRTWMKNALALNRLIAWYTVQSGYGTADLPRLLTREFRTIERPKLNEYRRYVRLALSSRLPLRQRVQQCLSLTATMLSSRVSQRRPSHTESATAVVERRAA